MKLTKESTISKIKSLFIHRNRISCIPTIDTNAAKNITDLLWPTGKIQGIIQEISTNPFGYLMITNIQVI